MAGDTANDLVQQALDLTLKHTNERKYIANSGLISARSEDEYLQQLKIDEVGSLFVPTWPAVACVSFLLGFILQQRVDRALLLTAGILSTFFFAEKSAYHYDSTKLLTHQRFIIVSMMAKLLQQYNEFSLLLSSSYSILPPLNEGFCRALEGVRYKAHDCVSLSGLFILYLLRLKKEADVPLKIERLDRSGSTAFPHTVVVVNRTMGNIWDLKTWNDDSILICPWYGKTFQLKAIKNDSNLLSKYPLLQSLFKDLNDGTRLRGIEVKIDASNQGAYNVVQREFDCRCPASQREAETPLEFKVD